MEKRVDYSLISFRPITQSHEDLEFLFRLYASTRAVEMAMTGWSPRQVEEFLLMQFNLQHTQYLRDYKNASFEIVCYRGQPIGRLYVDRRQKEIRVLDAALLPGFRRKGVGSRLFNGLIAEADRKKLPLNLHVEINNPAFNFYERLGFKKVRDVGMHFFMERQPANEDVD